jgi:hypothetical protein
MRELLVSDHRQRGGYDDTDDGTHSLLSGGDYSLMQDSDDE